MSRSRRTTKPTQQTAGTSKKPKRKYGQYLPRGLRQKLADHFNLSVAAIDSRIQRNHKDTLQMAKKMIRDEASGIIGTILKAKGKAKADSRTREYVRRGIQIVNEAKKLKRAQLDLFAEQSPQERAHA